MTNIAKTNFTKEKLEENIIDDTNSNIMFNIIFPNDIIYIEKNLKTIICQKIIEDGFEGTVKVKHLYDYIKDNDMYILELRDNKLYAIGQFAKLYYTLNNTLIYLFFKYPDLISTMLSMCILDIYSNRYTVSLDMISNKPNIIQKYPSELKKYINQFEITNDLFNDDQKLEEIKHKLRENIPIDNTFTWIQKCSDYDVSSNNIRFVDSQNKIELIRNLKHTFNSNAGSVCNDSITTFYKDSHLIKAFETFSISIQNNIVGGYKINKKTKIKTHKRKTHKRKTHKRKSTKTIKI
jgi:hypothetical protein